MITRMPEYEYTVALEHLLFSLLPTTDISSFKYKYMYILQLWLNGCVIFIFLADIIASSLCQLTTNAYTICVNNHIGC